MTKEIPDVTIKPSEMLTKEQLENRGSIQYLTEDEAVKWYCEGYRAGKLGEYRGEEWLAILVDHLREGDALGREELQTYRESFQAEDLQNIIELLAKYGVVISLSECQHFADSISFIDLKHLTAIFLAQGRRFEDESAFGYTAISFSEKAYLVSNRHMSNEEFSTFFTHELLHLLSRSFDENRKISKNSLVKPGQFGFVNEWVVDYLINQIGRDKKVLYPQTPFMTLFEGIVDEGEIVRAAFTNEGYELLIDKIESVLGANAFNAILVHLSSFSQNSFNQARGFVEGINKLTLTSEQIEKAGYTEQDVANPNVIIKSEPAELIT